MSHLHDIADDNGHDDAVYSNGFTKYNAHQILCTNSWCLNTTSKYTRSCCQNAPTTKMTTGYRIQMCLIVRRMNIRLAYHLY